jgi:hypothetical protein
VLAPFSIGAEGLYKSALAFRHENCSVVYSTKCQICGLFSLQRDCLLKHGVRPDHGDQTNGESTWEIGDSGTKSGTSVFG